MRVKSIDEAGTPFPLRLEVLPAPDTTTNEEEEEVPLEVPKHLRHEVDEAAPRKEAAAARLSVVRMAHRLKCARSQDRK